MTSESRHLVLEQELQAPRAAVWHGWTEPRALAAWYSNPGRPGPDVAASVELRPGGFWRVFMDVSDDNRYWSGGRYLELAPFQRLVWAWGAVRGWPEIGERPTDDESIATVELSELETGGTRMTFTVELNPGSIPDDWVAMCRRGWTDTLGRFEVGPSVV